MQSMRSHERQFGFKQTTLGNQHIQIIRQTTLIAKTGQTECRPQGLDLLQLCRSLFANGSTATRESSTSLKATNTDCSYCANACLAWASAARC